MFTQLYLNDSFMIRKIIVAAVPAALVAVGMSLAISEPASSQRMRGVFIPSSGMPEYQLNSGGGGGGAATNRNTANTNQVYPSNRRSGFLDTQGAFQLSTGGGRGGHRHSGY